MTSSERKIRELKARRGLPTIYEDPLNEEEDHSETNMHQKVRGMLKTMALKMRSRMTVVATTS